MSEHIGPSLWHGREINSCTRCKYLRSALVRSGRRPDYEFFCMHPAVLARDFDKADEDRFMAKVVELLPNKAQYFQERYQKDAENRAKRGLFISNDEDTPETPDWCPVVAEKR